MIRNTPYKDSYYYKEEPSTAYRSAYDLQESRRIYESLLDENARLRQQLRYVPVPAQSYPPMQTHLHYYSTPNKNKIYSPNELESMSHTLPVHPDPYPSVSYNPQSMIVEKICPYNYNEQPNMAMYNLDQRNRYLERKIDRLRKELENQTVKLERYYEQARNHTACKECYQKKYCELLRITSPQ